MTSNMAFMSQPSVCQRSVERLSVYCHQGVRFLDGCFPQVCQFGVMDYQEYCHACQADSASLQLRCLGAFLQESKARSELAVGSSVSVKDEQRGSHASVSEWLMFTIGAVSGRLTGLRSKICGG